MVASTRLTPLTIATALSETTLREAKLVAGAAGIDRRIDSVAVLDVADLEGVRSNQLVLVSAYALQKTSLRVLVRRLAGRDASGLGIKLDPYWPTMPETLIEAADSVSLPLLALPPGRFEDLVNPLLAGIVDRQAEVLRSIADFHRELTEAALRDEGPGSAAAILNSALGLEVAIFDEDGELLAAAGGAEEWAERLADAAVSAAAGGSVESEGESYLSAPISAEGRRYGAVCVRGPSPADAVARAAVAQAAVVTGMQLLGRRQVETVHRRFERELLDDLVGGRLAEVDARERAERMGWPVRRPYLVLLAGRRSAPGTIDGVVGHHELASLMRALRERPSSAHDFRYRGGLACMVHFSRADDPLLVADAIGERLARVRGVPWAAKELVLAVSRPARDIALLPEAVRESALALAMSSELRRGERRVVHFDDLGAARLLAKTGDREHLAAMAHAELAPLGDPAAPGVSDLLETLTVLLAHNMKLAESAYRLFFHYNTVRHRLARLRDVFGDRLNTPEGKLSLWLALVALRIGEFDAESRAVAVS
jgi:purine catabolism regulator